MGTLAAVALSERTADVAVAGGSEPAGAPSPLARSAGTGGGGVAVAPASPSPSRAAGEAPAVRPVPLATSLDVEHLVRRVTYGPTAAGLVG